VDDVELSPAAKKSPNLNIPVAQDATKLEVSSSYNNLLQPGLHQSSIASLPPLHTSSSSSSAPPRRSPRLSSQTVTSSSASASISASGNSPDSSSSYSSISSTFTKSPSDDQNDHPLDRKLGQAYAYMRKLRDDYGIRDVFGVVTSYAYWRIVWLPDTDFTATATLPRTQQDIKAVEEEELVEDITRSVG
jgi:hypothetical protein